MDKINQPKVSVIITAYNVESMKNIFKECLDSALNLKYDNYEVIVVNNGSTDKTREILKDYEKDLRIINLKKNIGLCGGNNIAYYNSRSEFVLLLEQDSIPEQDALMELVKIAKDNNKIGALGGIQVDYKKKKITGLGRLCDIYGNWIVQKDEISIDEVKESYYSYIFISFLLVKRKVIGDTLHPKEFFIYFEDVELCFRIWSRGYYVKLVPKIVCRHEFGTSVRNASKINPSLYRKLTFHNIKNSALLLSVYRKLLPKIYMLHIIKGLLRLPIIEIAHFPKYLAHKTNSGFIGVYYPLKNLTNVIYSMKKLSILDHYGNYIPLSIKLKNSKKFLFNPLNVAFNSAVPIKIDYEKMIINDDDIARSTRKFIIIK
jgi:GT2 family glycosyltransferase